MGAVETPIEHQETHQSQAVWGWGIRKWGSGARAREERALEQTEAGG